MDLKATSAEGLPACDLIQAPTLEHKLQEKLLAKMEEFDKALEQKVRAAEERWENLRKQQQDLKRKEMLAHDKVVRRLNVRNTALVFAAKDLKRKLQLKKKQLKQRDRKLQLISEKVVALTEIVKTWAQELSESEWEESSSDEEGEIKFKPMRARKCVGELEDSTSEEEEIRRELEPMRARKVYSEGEIEVSTSGEEIESELDWMRARNLHSVGELEDSTSGEEIESDWELPLKHLQDKRETALEQITVKEEERGRDLEKTMAMEAETQQKNEQPS